MTDYFNFSLILFSLIESEIVNSFLNLQFTPQNRNVSALQDLEVMIKW